MGFLSVHFVGGVLLAASPVLTVLQSWHAICLLPEYASTFMMKVAPLSVIFVVDVLPPQLSLANFSHHSVAGEISNWLRCKRSVLWARSPWADDLSHGRPVFQEMDVQTHPTLGPPVLLEARAVGWGCAPRYGLITAPREGAVQREPAAAAKKPGSNLSDSTKEGAVWLGTHHHLFSSLQTPALASKFRRVSLFGFLFNRCAKQSTVKEDHCRVVSSSLHGLPGNT